MGSVSSRKFSMTSTCGGTAGAPPIHRCPENNARADVPPITAALVGTANQFNVDPARARSSTSTADRRSLLDGPAFLRGHSRPLHFSRPAGRGRPPQPPPETKGGSRNVRVEP
jgi:hypothetical protein